jgi:hypothetical protein
VQRNGPLLYRKHREILRRSKETVVEFSILLRIHVLAHELNKKTLRVFAKPEAEYGMDLASGKPY